MYKLCVLYMCERTRFRRFILFRYFGCLDVLVRLHGPQVIKPMARKENEKKNLLASISNDNIKWEIQNENTWS